MNNWKRNSWDPIGIETQMKATSGKSAEEKALIHRIDLNRRIIKKDGDRLRKDGIRVSEHIRILEEKLRRLGIEC